MTHTNRMRPDFSGDYALNRAASALSGGATAIRSGFVHIEHADPVFRCRATFVADAKPLEYSFELLSDGREVSPSPRDVVSLRWEGEALVAVFTTKNPEAHVVNSWRYELQDGGRRLKAAERLSGGGRDEANVWIFDRVETPSRQASGLTSA